MSKTWTWSLIQAWTWSLIQAVIGWYLLSECPCFIFSVSQFLFVVDLILSGAQGQLTDDLNRFGIDGSLDPHPQTCIWNDLQTAAIVSITANTPIHSGEDCMWYNKAVQHPCSTASLIATADALASTGVLYRKDHLGIFRFGNLRTLGCDWLLWPHDNLGRKCSCVLSPSVSLEGSWGVFGGLGRPLSFNITGKQKKRRQAQYLESLHPCMTFHLLDVPSFAAIWICEDSWLRSVLHVKGVTN